MKKIIICLLVGFVVGMFLYPVLFREKIDVDVEIPHQIIALEPETTFIFSETPWEEIKERDIERPFVVDLFINNELHQIPMVFKATIRGQMINPRIEVLETKFTIPVAKESILKFYVGGEVCRYFDGIYEGQIEAGLAIKKTVFIFAGVKTSIQQNLVPFVGVRYIHYF